MKLSMNVNIPWNSEALNKLTRNQEVIGYFKNLVLELRRMYADIARAVNQNANFQYIAQDAQPTPEAGQLLIWKDTDAGAGDSIWYLVYNDNGNIATFGSEEKA
jgi:hypothetical protein